MTDIATQAAEVAALRAQARPGSLSVHVDAETAGRFDLLEFDQLACWMPVLGPTCSLLAATLARHPGVWESAVLADRLGVKTSQMWASMERCAMFKAVWLPSPDVVVVRRFLPELRWSQIQRMTDATRTYVSTFDPTVAARPVAS